MPRPAHRRPGQGRDVVHPWPAMGRGAPALRRGVRARGRRDRPAARLLTRFRWHFAVGGPRGLLLVVGLAGSLHRPFEFAEDLLDETPGALVRQSRPDGRFEAPG